MCDTGVTLKFSIFEAGEIKDIKLKGRGGKVDRKRGGEEERRKGGEEERWRGGEEERRRGGEKEYFESF